MTDCSEEEEEEEQEERVVRHPPAPHGCPLVEARRKRKAKRRTDPSTLTAQSMDCGHDIRHRTLGDSSRSPALPQQALTCSSSSSGDWSEMKSGRPQNGSECF